MRLLNKLSYGLDRLSRWIITFLLVTVTAVLFTQVFARFVLSTGTFWSDELARFATVWLVFLGASIAVREKSLITVDAMESMFPKLKRVLHYFQVIVTMIYCFLILKVGWGTLSLVMFQRSPNMGVPMSVLYAVIPVSATVMIIHLIVQLVHKKDEGENV
jgi:TRAP-type C4-dicarboxylate transport system permease small subunit